MEIDRISLVRPDDWHLHLRDGDEMRSVVTYSATAFSRAMIMPNLKPPVVTTEQAQAYRKRILQALPDSCRFQPMMTLYLTDNTPAEEIRRAKTAGTVLAVKYYPAGATTNSDSGVTDIRKCAAVLDEMSETGVPLLVHGEVTDPEVDVFDREKVFIERELVPLTRRHPALRVVLEHITTADAVKFIHAASENVAATITVHHLLLNRNSIFLGGVRPHHYCLPVLKREEHRKALLAAATSGNPRFFLGTDSAPHERTTKEARCGCAGIFTAHAALELYTEVFESQDALDRLEGFASFHGADFYRLPRNRETITLQRRAWSVPQSLVFADGELVPLRAGETIQWKIAG